MPYKPKAVDNVTIRPAGFFLWAIFMYCTLVNKSQNDGIFVLISWSQIHEQRLKSSGQYSETEVKQAVADVTVYQQLHQDRPGFFDTAVNTGPTNANIHTHIRIVSHASTVKPLPCEQKKCPSSILTVVALYTQIWHLEQQKVSCLSYFMVSWLEGFYCSWS